MRWRALVFIGICGLLVVGASVLLVQIAWNFPNSGGFTRHVLFIRPTTDQAGYFIIVDEVELMPIPQQVDAVFHGRGTLQVNATDSSASWMVPSYLNLSQNVNLTLTCFTPVESITAKSGWVHHGYETGYEQLPYIVVRPPVGQAMHGAILYPVNETMSPPVFSRGSRSSWINGWDFIHVQDTSRTATIGNITTNAKITFLRINSTGHATDFFLYGGSSLTYNGTILRQDAQRRSIVWSNSTSYTSSIDILTKPQSNHGVPSLPAVTHPFLYYNLTTFPGLQQKINTTNPWNQWFLQLKSSTQSYLTGDIGSVEVSRRAEVALNLAFVSQIHDNMTFLNRSKEYLSRIPDVTAYPGSAEDLRRSIATMNYLLAFDMIYQNSTTPEREEYKGNILAHAQRLYDTFPSTPRNNHILIRSGACGLVGLAFSKHSWLSVSIEAIDAYLNNHIRAEGACYEGQSYEAYGVLHLLPFIYALNLTTGMDYFQDQNFQRLFAFNVNSSSPLGTLPLFEDSRRNAELVEMCLWAAPHLPQGEYLQWLFDRRSNATVFSGRSPSVSRLILYNNTVTPVAPSWNASGVYSDSGLAFLREDWGNSSLYLTFGSKPYVHSHAHMDQNAFELWAYGAYLLANPGYGGFGDEHHPWLTTTEASNTILLNGDGQFQEAAEGFQESILTSNIDYVSGAAFQSYVHPGSFTSHPGLLGLIITLFIMVGAMLGTFFVMSWKRPKKNEKLVSGGKSGDIKKLTWKEAFVQPAGVLGFQSSGPKYNAHLKNPKFKHAFLWSQCAILILLSYLELLSLITIITPYLAAYDLPTISYFEAVQLIEMLELLLFIAIPFVVVGGIWFARFVFNRGYQELFAMNFPEYSKKEWKGKNLESVLLPLIAVEVIGAILLFFVINPHFLALFDYALTGIGSVEDVLKNLLHFLSLSSIIALIGFILSLPFLTWSILALVWYIRAQVSIPKRYILGTLIIGILFVISIGILLALTGYYFAVDLIDGLNITDIMS